MRAASMGVVAVLGGCSLAATSATPHHATAGGPPTGCDSVVWPVGDFLLAPVATLLGGALFVGESIESGTPPRDYVAPLLLVSTGITALVSGFVGFSRIGRCKDALPRTTPSPAAPAPAGPSAPDPIDDSRPSWGE